jgi:hypothetical protein
MLVAPHFNRGGDESQIRRFAVPPSQAAAARRASFGTRTPDDMIPADAWNDREETSHARRANHLGLGRHGGKPRIRGLRITVDTILGLLAAGKSREWILEAYPYLAPQDIDAAMGYEA